MQEEQRILLNGTWKFIVDADNSGEEQGYGQEVISEKTWREVEIPSVFESCLPRLQDYPGVCWFRRSFDMPSDLNEKKIILHFEGVNYITDVWVNGIKAGHFEQGYLPFEFDITKQVKAGENTVVVKVNGARHPGQLPPTHFWRHHGGIIRDVFLRVDSCISIDYVDITASIISGGGHLDVRAEIFSETEVRESCLVEFSLWDARGKAAASLGTVPVEVPCGERAEVRLSQDVAGAAWWSPDSPALYTLKTRLLQGSEVLSCQEKTFGFKRIEAANGKILLNGKELFLVGFNRHEDSKDKHMAVNRESSLRDIENMKAMGANFVRMCHYPHDSYELDLCDRLGLLVLDEIPLNAYLFSFPFTNDKELLNALPKVRRNAEFMLEQMIRRDKHHPCVAFWSVSNESGEHMEEVRELNNHLLQHARALDATRLIVHVTLGSTWLSDYADKTYIYDDVICVNSYDFGDKVRKDYLSGQPYDPDAIREFWRRNVERMAEMYPGKPVMATEFGFQILPGHDAEEEEQMQADYLAMSMEAFAPYLAGCSIWAYADHDWPQVWPQMENMFGNPVSTFGLLSQDRAHRRKGCEALTRFAKSIYRE